MENAGEEAPVRHGVSNGSWDIFLVSFGCKRFKIYKQHHQPAPSKGCQMVAQGCQLTISWGLIGTPLKVQEVAKQSFNRIVPLFSKIVRGVPTIALVEANRKGDDVASSQLQVIKHWIP